MAKTRARRPDSSVMDWFAARGFDTWCMDHEGYGRSDKSRPINCDIPNGADDLAAGSEYVLKHSQQKKLLVYGISSGALRAALFTERHPERVARIALDAFVRTGKGSPTLAERKKKLPEFQTKNRRPIDRAFVRSIFTRDHPGTADDATIEAFAGAILELDGIASLEDALEFYRLLPNPDKQFALMAGISHASFQQKNYLTAYHILHAFFTTPEPVYRA